MPPPLLFDSPACRRHRILPSPLPPWEGRTKMAPHSHSKTPNSFRKINIYRPLSAILIKDPLEFIPSRCCFDIKESYKISCCHCCCEADTEAMSFVLFCFFFCHEMRLKEDDCSKPSQNTLRRTKFREPLDYGFGGVFLFVCFLPTRLSVRHSMMLPPFQNLCCKEKVQKTLNGNLCAAEDGTMLADCLQPPGHRRSCC